LILSEPLGAAQQTEVVPQKERLAFYLSAFLRDMSYAMWNQVTTFYVDVLGFATGRFKWILRWLPVVQRIYDGVNDPLVGAYYDRRPYTTSKARPFFKTTAVPVAVGLVCAFLPVTFSANETVNMLSRAAFALFAYFLYEGFQTANATAHMSVYNSISPNIGERTSIVALARMFATGGSGLVSGFVPVIYGMLDQQDVAAKRRLFFWTALVVALLYLLYNRLMYTKVHERTIVPAKEMPALKTQLRNILCNQPFCVMMISNALSGIFNSGSTDVYFYQYNIGNAGMMTLVGLMGIPAYVLSGWLTPWLCKRVEKRTLFILCTGLQIFISAFYLFYGYDSLFVIFAQSFLSNIPGAIKSSLYWIMISDTVDYGEWKTGVRGDGMIYAIEGMTNKIVGAVGQMSTQLILEYTRFVPNAVAQSAFTMRGLFRVPLYIKIAGSIAQASPYFFHRFTIDAQTQVIAEIQARKAVLHESDLS
jgi:Na+/melibiose symporter-like transporter